MSVHKCSPTKDGKSWVFRCRYKTIMGEEKNYRSKKFKTKKEKYSENKRKKNT